ncbi:CoA pyrophosphatase [Geotalea sp. SG265]|uniref:NUDIX hydrolase n=1 Tax=Geotalea sp. SG265 TaxID=2922867 RepID=UPI001FAF1E80|nr:CoA pyrophosphatase [Geotalea sp. SG265]
MDSGTCANQISFFDTVESTLALREPEMLPADRRVKASVALILREGEIGPEMLFIERARHKGDPWSGDLGFPGGKVEVSDGDAYSAAMRETVEEIGLDLSAARFLGCLAEIAGATLPVRVTCFVFALEQTPQLTLNGEVQDVFWVSLADLRDLNRHILTPVSVKGELVHFPAVIVPLSGKPPLWGLTYRMVKRFFELVPDMGG